jgi:hypothetical protein
VCLPFRHTGIMAPDLDDFARALGAIENAIDWTLLGTYYCHEGGESFFPDEQVAAMREAGLCIAGELGEELGPRTGGPRRSLYLGAAVGELVPILMERFVLQREVLVVNLPCPEMDELKRAFDVAASETGLALPRLCTEGLEEIDGPFDHGWMVSVLNDPDAFPALHDQLYGRSGEQATGRGDLNEDRANAEVLAGALLDRLTSDALFSTSAEELPILRPLFSKRGIQVTASRCEILTAVVGDPLRLLRLRDA